MPDSPFLDASAWPLVIARLGATFDVHAIDAFVKQYDVILARASKFALVVDTRELTKLPNALERQRTAELWKSRSFSESLYNVGSGVVIASAAARAALTAIFWLRPPTAPLHVFGHVPDAVEWCCARLASCGVALTPATEAMRQARAQLR